MATKKKCTRCGKKTENWMIVNGGPVICWPCNADIVHAEDLAKANKKKQTNQLVKIEMVMVVNVDEMEDIDDFDHYFEDLLGGGKNDLVHGVVGMEILAKGPKFGPGAVLDEYPPYDDGETYHSLDKKVKKKL